MGMMEDVLAQSRQTSRSASSAYSTTGSGRAASLFSGSAVTLGSLGVAIILVGLTLVWKGLAQPAPLPLPSAPVSAPATEIAVPLPTPFPAPEPVVAAPSNLPPALTLNGIVEGVGEPFAIINGGFVRLGETIEGATLLDVTSDSAQLHWQDQDFVLRMSRAGSPPRSRDTTAARSSPSASSSRPASDQSESDEDAPTP